MSQPIFTIEEITTSNKIIWRLVKFEIPDGVTSPSEFAAAVANIETSLIGNLPILISGRGPIWGYGMLLHAAHPTPAIALFDPRLGYVVVQSHDPRFRVGEVLIVDT